MNKRLIINVLLILSIALLVLSGCNKQKPAVSIGPNESTVIPETSAQTDIRVVEENTFVCSLNGQLLEDEKTNLLRPIAVMIDNQASARPQSGLSRADIVYEMPVEGKITRYMAIFHHYNVDKIGPVRSARPYFIDKAMEYNAVYVHCGGSPQALKDLVDLKIDTLNDLKGSPCFWRSKDRNPPHNLYTSSKSMREVMAKYKIDNKTAPNYFNISQEFIEISGKNTKSFYIDYDKNYKVGYEYDENEKIFYRMINGQKIKDKETDEYIKAVNIIIERVDANVIDSVGRIELSNIGSNRGYFLTGGKLTEIEWFKNDRKGKTIYKELNGKGIVLNKGVTWIQVVPDYAAVKVLE